MRRAISVLGSLVLTATAMGQPRIPPQVLGQIKASTVYVKTRVGSLVVAGSGFLFERQGATGIVVTNAHVVSRGSGVGGRVEVVFFSGTPGEQRMDATIVSLDKDRDLALLRVTADKLPMPLNRMRSTGLTETLPVYVIGFPFGEELAARRGNPEITLSTGSISSLRKDDQGNLAAIQVNGGVNPGNSGGPVVDARGDLVGIAVAMVSGTQIGLAIPAESLSEMLLGRVSGAAMTEKASGKGWVEIQCEVRLIDPMGAIQRVSVLYAPQGSPGNEAKPRADGPFGPLMNAREQVLKIEGEAATGAFRIAVKPGESLEYLQQIKCVRRNRKVLYTEPASLQVGRTGSEETTARSERLGRPDKAAKPRIDEVWAPMMPVETAPAAVDTVTKLAAPIEDLAVAGMGRYLVCKLRDLPGLTLYDAYQAKIARTLRLPSPQFLFAAGGDRAVVYLKDENLIQTWELSTGNKLKTKPNPFPQSVSALLMGYGRGDQAFVMLGDESSHRGGAALLNLDTVQPVELATSGNAGMGLGLSLGSGIRLRANYDLSRIGAMRMGVSPSGLTIMRRSGATYDLKYEHVSEGIPIPGDDGRVYTNTGHIYTSDLVSVGTLSGNLLIPALGGGFVIAMDDKGRMTIYEAGKTTPLTPWGPFPGWSDKSNEGWQKSRWNPEMLSADRRIIFAPNLGRLILIPLEADSIILKAFSLKETLDKAGIDYIVVTSTPPVDVKPRQQWKYQVEVLSKAGGVKYAVELGPPGMNISNTGLITWTIPSSMGESGEKVVVLVTDSSGEQAYHTFTLHLFGRAAGAGLTR